MIDTRARSNISHHTRRDIARPRPMNHASASIRQPCTTKRPSVTTPTGTCCAASLEATSIKGAITQKVIIKATPGKMRSVLVIAKR
jgi:hypothetical protein